MSATEENHINFIKNELIELLSKTSDKLKGKKVVDYNVSFNKTFDGFMSYIYQLDLKVQSRDDE